MKKEKSQKQKFYNKSFIAKKISTRIFHKQKLPAPFVKWKDDMFKPEKESFCPYDENGQWILFKNLDEDDLEGWEEYNWCRIEELNESEEYNIFQDGASVSDIIQGDINDCYFLSAIGALCSYPSFFDKLFHTKERTEENCFGIYLFLNGKWKLVLLDNYFPYYLEEYILKELCFSSSCQKELWVSLLEKAWAKVNGGYARIGCRGFSREAFDILTEAYTEQLDIRIYARENRENELWEILKKSFEKKDVLTAGTVPAE